MSFGRSGELKSVFNLKDRNSDPWQVVYCTLVNALVETPISRESIIPYPKIRMEKHTKILHVT